MIIDIQRQLILDASFPLDPVHVYTGSALILELRGVPRARSGAAVRGVKVSVTNADGITIDAEADKFTDGVWRVVFAASNFSTYGSIDGGVLIRLKLDDDGVERWETVARGHLVVMAASASVAPGDPSAHYQTKGDDEFVKSVKVGDVQHFKKIEIAYDSEMGDWGFNLTGDYILSAGEFVPANEGGAA